MDWFIDLISNRYLIAGACSWFLAQIIKSIIYAAINKQWVWERMVGDGGMPSCHSATVAALTTTAAFAAGFGSFEFAITAMLAIIVCHDAMGVRLETGKQAVIINDLIKAFEDLTKEEISETALKEFVGHTPVQVIAGVLIGIANACFLNLVFFA